MVGKEIVERRGSFQKTGNVPWFQEWAFGVVCSKHISITPHHKESGHTTQAKLMKALCQIFSRNYPVISLRTLRRKK